MSEDLIKRSDAIETAYQLRHKPNDAEWTEWLKSFNAIPSAESTHREKALLLLLDWAVECGFGYDNIPEEYATYEKYIENMGYMEGLIYIAEREVEQNE